MSTVDTFQKTFLPTPSARRATENGLGEFSDQTNFYPRPPRGGRPKLEAINAKGKKISTHALREEGDPAPRRTGIADVLFLPTPSARRATGWLKSNATPVQNFYPRPPRGGRLLRAKDTIADQIFLPTPSARRATRQRADQYVPGEISTHALREEGDAANFGLC